MKRASLLFIAAVGMLIAITAYTRAPTPWQNSLTTDEMWHLESWRNRYRTDDIYPLFLRKLEARNLLSGEQMTLFKKVYASSPLFQRGLLLIAEGHPPVSTALAEVIEATTHSSLIAARLPSAIASILAVFFMYRLGRELRGTSLGLWLATLLAIGTLSQTYAGIARPYAMAQCALVIFLYVFVREQRMPQRSPWRFWLAALFAQGTGWISWAIVGPVVLVEVVRRLQRGDRVMSLLRQSWWYGLLSVMLLALMAVQYSNPSIQGQGGVKGLGVILYYFAVASPFANLDLLVWGDAVTPVSSEFTFARIWVSLVLWLFCMMCGLCCLLADRGYRRPQPEAGLARPAVLWGLGLALAASMVAPLVLAITTRFMLFYLVVPTVLAAIGLDWICMRERISTAAVTAVLVIFMVVRIGWPEGQHSRLFVNETDYEPVAKLIEEQLQPGDIWAGYHFSLANCMYRFAELPEPVELTSKSQFDAFLETLPREDGATIILTSADNTALYLFLDRAPEKWRFGQVVVIRIPPAERRRRGRF